MSNNFDPEYKVYLEEIGTYMVERGLDAKKSMSEEEKESPEYLYHEGRLLAYHDIVSIMQQYAGGFFINLKEIGLHEINPDKDLT